MGPWTQLPAPSVGVCVCRGPAGSHCVVFSLISLLLHTLPFVCLSRDLSQAHPGRASLMCGRYPCLVLLYVSLGFLFPHSFSFTFPRPPVIFNSVIMTYSVGTWHSPSPTLHSRPWPSCGQHSFPEQQADGSSAARCQSAVLAVSPAPGSRSGQKMEAAERCRDTSSQLLRGTVSWV